MLAPFENHLFCDELRLLLGRRLINAVNLVEASLSTHKEEE